MSELVVRSGSWAIYSHFNVFNSDLANFASSVGPTECEQLDLLDGSLELRVHWLRVSIIAAPGFAVQTVETEDFWI